MRARLKGKAKKAQAKINIAESALRRIQPRHRNARIRREHAAIWIGCSCKVCSGAA